MILHNILNWMYNKKGHSPITLEQAKYSLDVARLQFERSKLKMKVYVPMEDRRCSGTDQRKGLKDRREQSGWDRRKEDRRKEQTPFV